MAGPLRVAFLTTGLLFGGAERQLVNLAIRLQARGWEPQVISMLPAAAAADGPGVPDPGSGLDKELVRAGIRVISLGMRPGVPDLRAVFVLTGHLRAWRPHVLHSHMVHANLLARIVRILYWTPVQISTAHSVNEGGKWRELAYRITDPLCTLTTNVSQAAVERYVRAGVVPRHRIRYVPNAVDRQRFRPDPSVRARVRQQFGLHQEHFVWLAVGRFVEAKDYGTMIRAFGKLSQARCEGRLLLVGTGDLQAQMIALATHLGLSDKVQFLGLRVDIPELMNGSDAYVMSSAWEGMPTVLLEAAASGLAIVATDVGGIREVVRQDVSGLLVPARDPDALARAMEHLMMLPLATRQQMGTAALAHVAEHYDIDRVAAQWDALYRELLRGTGLRSGLSP